MNYEEALAWIHGHPRFAGEQALARVRALLHELGDPQDCLRCVHIAGTNGKGSTAAMLARVLEQAGYRTGRYISPYVLEFRERMEINGAMISRRDLAALAQEVHRAEQRTGMVAEFGAVTALALLWFARQRCDIVCLEVGLGGRLDATNAIPPPPVQIITRVDYDHTGILGNTLAEIAREKCGIIKGGTVITCPSQPIEVLEEILRRCAQTGATLLQPHAGAITPLPAPLLDGLPRAVRGTAFSYGGLELSPSLPGAHQIENAVLVVEAARALARWGLPLEDGDIAAGIATTRLAARAEVLCQRPLVLLDGAHNPAGARALGVLLDGLREEGWRIHLLIGMLEDKDWRGVLGELACRADQLWATTPDSPRALPAGKLALAARRSCASCLARPDLARALAEALAALRGRDALVVCGSLYLASQARPYLTKIEEKR